MPNSIDFKGMPDSIDFYERMFLHVIPVRTVVSWYNLPPLEVNKSRKFSGKKLNYKLLRNL